MYMCAYYVQKIRIPIYISDFFSLSLLFYFIYHSVWYNIQFLFYSNQRSFSFVYIINLVFMSFQCFDQIEFNITSAEGRYLIDDLVSNIARAQYGLLKKLAFDTYYYPECRASLMLYTSNLSSSQLVESWKSTFMHIVEPYFRQVEVSISWHGAMGQEFGSCWHCTSAILEIKMGQHLCDTTW